MQKSISVSKTNDDIAKLNQNDIMYISIKDKISFFHMADGTIFKTKKSLKDTSALLNKNIFIQIYQSIVINVKYNTGFNKEEMLAIMSDSKSLPIAHRKLSEFKAFLLEASAMV